MQKKGHETNGSSPSPLTLAPWRFRGRRCGLHPSSPCLHTCTHADAFIRLRVRFTWINVVLQLTSVAYSSSEQDAPFNAQRSPPPFQTAPWYRVPQTGCSAHSISTSLLIDKSPCVWSHVLMGNYFLRLTLEMHCSIKGKVYFQIWCVEEHCFPMSFPHWHNRQRFWKTAPGSDPCCCRSLRFYFSSVG